MEMTTYQAIFAVLLVFCVGDLIGAVTKAKISSMFVIMMGFMILFMTGTYPADIMTISGFSGLASIGMYFLLFNMGTSVELSVIKREWRTVVCSAMGMGAAILGCVVAAPIIGLEYALVAAPVVNGGIIAANTMVAAATEKGLETAAVMGTFIYAVQKYVGTLPASNCGLSVASGLVADIREKHLADPNYSWYTENSTVVSGVKKVMFWERYKKYYTVFISLFIAATFMYLSQLLAGLCAGWVNMAIWCMVLGIVARNTGLVPSNLLRDYAKANGFFSFLALCTIIPSLANVNLGDLPAIGFKTLIIFVFVILFTFILFFLTPAWKIVGSKQLCIGIAMCQMIGYPGTELIATEITNAVAQTDEERDAVSAKIQTAYVISGFTSVTILSVFIASFLARIL